ncbi:MAG: phospholipid carrier-dependent glycosyltransferase [Chloroflexi bacterium]|nr:phospholipid carrier-dependent glycosyltransferase [Chloroflexota bacterium]
MALLVRLWGIDWQLPAALYFDELKYVEWAGAMSADRPPETTDFRNPSLYRHLLALEYRAANLIQPSGDVRSTAVLHLWLARLTSAILGALACVLTGLTGAHLASVLWTPRLGVVAGLAAGLTLALSLLHVHISHYAVNDAVGSAFLAAGLLFGLRAAISPWVRDVALAGLCAGLAFGTKYNFGVVLVLPLAVAAVSALPELGVHPAPLRGDRRFAPGYAFRLLVAALLSAALGACIAMPELVTAPREVLAGMVEQARIGQEPWNGQSDAPVWLLYGESLLRGIGPGALAVAALGVLALARSHQALLLAILLVPICYLAVMLGSALFFARFALPLLSPLAILVGLGIARIARFNRGGATASLVLAGGLMTLVLVPQTLAVVDHDRLAATTDTRIQAEAWLERHAAGSAAVVEVYTVPITWSGLTVSRRYRTLRVSSLVDAPVLYRAACAGARYALVSSLTRERKMASRHDTWASTGYEVLRREAKLVATFDPFREGLSVPAHPDDTGIPFWYLGAYARPGPRIDVYELPARWQERCEATGG